MSMWSIPRGASASMTALATAGGAPLHPASPTPVTPNGLNGFRRPRSHGGELRNPGSARSRLIHQRAGENLAVIAEEHLFAKRLAETLSHAAVNLPVENHGVDDNAAVIDQDELFKSRHP